MKKTKLMLLILLLSSLSICLAQEINPIPEFTKKDRILILAPHPDDEAIGTAGVIQQAIKAGSSLKLVCYTNGDNNEFAFIVYEKRLTFKKKEFLHMGEVRSKETIAAMDSLGLSRDNIIFLGYPDFGTLEILTKYWGNNIKPFKSMLTRVKNISYPFAMSPGAPYVGESILMDLKKILRDFKPTKIFVSHPGDSNRDHRSLYLFLNIALWDLAIEINEPQIFTYIIHIAGWPKPRGFRPEVELEPYKNIKAIDWHKLSLTENELLAKRNTINFYKSQIKYNPPYLFTFAKKDELFGNYPSLVLKEETSKEINWHPVVKDLTLKEQTIKNRNHTQNLFYAVKDNYLFIKLGLKRKIDEKLGISFFLLGYNKKIKFSEMPKINLTVDFTGLHIKDKKQTFFNKDVQLRFVNSSLIINIPLSVLKNPNYILSCAKTNSNELTFDENAWHIIELK